jgi:hypothetical protein
VDVVVSNGYSSEKRVCHQEEVRYWFSLKNNRYLFQVVEKRILNGLEFDVYELEKDVYKFSWSFGRTKHPSLLFEQTSGKLVVHLRTNPVQ